jgi:hypothetical protein
MTNAPERNVPLVAGEVGLGDDAAQAAVRVHDRNTADAVVDHEPGDDVERRIFAHGDGFARHAVADDHGVLLGTLQVRISNQDPPIMPWRTA